MSQKTGKFWRWPAELGGPLASRNERMMRLSWDFHMAPSTNRSGREPFKLVMLGSNPAGVTISHGLTIKTAECQRKHGFASSTTPGGWRKKTSNDMEQYKRFRQTLK